MAATSVPRKLAAGDLARLPGDGRRHEILDGVHYATASPSPRHQRVLHRLTLRPGNYVGARHGGEVFGSALDRSSPGMTSPFRTFSSSRTSGARSSGRRTSKVLTAEGDDLLASPLFPGLEIPLRELFAR